MKKIMVAAVAALCAHAQAESFNGFSAGLSIGSSATRIKSDSISKARISMSKEQYTRITGFQFGNAAVVDEDEGLVIQEGDAVSSVSSTEEEEMITVAFSKFVEDGKNTLDEHRVNHLLKAFGASDFSASKVNLIVSAFVGYTKSFSNNVYAGADVGFTYERLSGASRKIANVFGFSVDPRIGYKMNDTTGVYGKISVGSQYLRGDAKDVFSRSIFFVTPAIGVEKYLTDKISIRGEVGYKIQKLKFKAVEFHGMKLSDRKASRNAVTFSISSIFNF
ncbi:MAG: hypothetical protein CNLJKLNK_00723 [Holosporales bacterium]